MRAISLFGTVVTFASATAACTPTPVTGDALLLGTVVRIQAYRPANAALIDAALARVAEIEATMSTSEADYDTTELLELNRAPVASGYTVSPDTILVIERALYFAELSDGAFDPSIWPLVRLWNIGSEHPAVPTRPAVETARRLVNFRDVHIGPSGLVRFARQGMGIDVGAIAKGYAADEVVAMLRGAGVTSAMLDFGGNIYALGRKPDGTAWRIGVQRPDAARSQLLGVLEVADRSVVTSGPYERFFLDGGVRYHHLIDPATGFPAETGIEQVTIVSERSIDADALSTAVYIMGPTRGLALIESLPEVEGIIVNAEREVYTTAGIAPMFELLDTDATLRE